MASDEDRERHRRRLKRTRSHIARSLEEKPFRQRKVERRRREDEDEERFRRYGKSILSGLDDE